MKPADFRTLILSKSAIAALVVDRVFPLVVPQERWDSDSQKPCLIYAVDNVTRVHLVDQGTTDMQQLQVTINAVSPSYDDTVALADAVSTLNGYSGVVGDTRFESVVLDAESDALDVEPGLYRRVMSFTIWNRSNPA